ncbi:hypothetical protein S7711_10263 [Stachybotrys chartarum IBT 7711]|uniref:Life-span regulatory factor domain-containing protein n=1 Tax=Stachybotrys chartarum (strain CBS 109288 / IBT 7711) TaxID=1280523 RepID=A0A084AF49_STACB|nr:hypothetical protein S7711_10263 [Stachybotrys chartarum IBT 7711]KFA51181.1 hypothetical protein S40293_09371 [Stachybotrys chartarum IBT 40293]
MHHQRRKSGNNSSTDVRRALTATDMTKYKRPSMTRRHTPANAQKTSKSQRDWEREGTEMWDDERESFPQYCMSCEKQFVAHDARHLYCSDTCRRTDQNVASHTPARSQSGGHYPFYSAGVPEPKDIVPRASPSRPGSMHFSNSPPTSPGTSAYPYHSSAVSALRSLNVRPPSPPSPTNTSGAIWPFSRSAATSPSTSYTRPSAGFFSSTYDAAYSGAYTYDMNMGSSGMERPLPSRQPGGYSRPKSIELVTPMVGR